MAHLPGCHRTGFQFAGDLGDQILLLLMRLALRVLETGHSRRAHAQPDAGGDCRIIGDAVRDRRATDAGEIGRALAQKGTAPAHAGGDPHQQKRD